MSKPISSAEYKLLKARRDRFAKLEKNAGPLAEYLWNALDYDQWDQLREYSDAILDEAMQVVEDRELEASK